MSNVIRQIVAHFGVFFGLLALLWLALSASAMIPNSALQENYERSAWHFGQVEAFHYHDADKRYSISHNYADAILLNIAWHMGDGDSPFESSLATYYYDGEELGENMGLLQSVTEDAEPNTDYTRYWHGTAMFARVLHLFTDINGMKAIGLAVAIALASLVVVLLIRRGHADFAALFVVSLVSVQLWMIGNCLEYQSAFIIAFLMCVLFLTFDREGDRWLMLLSTASGVLVAFFDFLTNETLAVLMPLILVIAVRAREGRLASLKDGALLVVKCGLCWLAAYAGSYMVKWIAASMVTGVDEVSFALGATTVHLGEANTSAVGAVGPFTGLAANVATFLGSSERAFTLNNAVVVAVILLLLVVAWRLAPAADGHRDAAVLLLVLGGLVFLRYILLGGHSYGHDFFTYRALASTVLAILLALRLNMSLPIERGESR